MLKLNHDSPATGKILRNVEGLPGTPLWRTGCELLAMFKKDAIAANIADVMPSCLSLLRRLC